MYKDKLLMGNFSSRQNKVDNARERDNQRRDRLAGYFYDLSKLSFAGLVIGVITQLFTDGGGEANLSVIISWWEAFISGHTQSVERNGLKTFKRFCSVSILHRRSSSRAA